MKKLLLTLLTLVTLLLPISSSVAYGTEVQTRTNVNIQANVPNDFTESISFTLTNKQTGEQIYTWLEPSNNYINTLNVIGGIEYNITISFSSKDNYSILGITDTVFIKGDIFSLKFNIVKNKKQEVEITTENTDSENIKPNNHTDMIAQGEMLFSKSYKEILNYYGLQNDISYVKEEIGLYYEMELNDLYNHLSNLSINDIIIDKSQLTDIDTIVYYFYNDYLHSFEYCIDDKDSFMEKINAYQNRINTFIEEEHARDISLNTFSAIADVWEWIYEYYQQTGIIYDFYTNDNIPYVAELKEQLGIKLTPNNDTTIVTTNPQETTTSSSSNITNNENTTEKINNNLDKNDNNLIIVFVIIISLLICAVLILLAILFFKNKNNSTTNNNDAM